MNKSRDDALNKAIESVVERGVNKPGQAQTGGGERHEKVDQALRQRLQQLRSAMGDESPAAAPREAATAPVPAPTPTAPVATFPFGPSPMPTLEIPAPVASRSAPSGNLRMVMWLGAALVLAAVAWYVLTRGSPATTPAPVQMADATPSAPPAAKPAAESSPAQSVTEPQTTSVAAAPAETPAPAPSAPPVAPPAAATAAAVAAAAPATAVPAPPPDPSEQLRGMVEAWRQAWSNRDTESYLSFYSASFEPGKGQSLSQWRASRYRNVGGKTSIKVQINDLQVALTNNGSAQITFLQDYTSGNYQESAQPKTLIVAREADAWRIVKEWQGNESY
jgi:ketosteroid isomerase-like protein